MRVMVWNVLFLSFLFCYQPFFFAGKKKPSSSLTRRIDSLLKEIDVVHDSHANSHDAMAGMAGMEGMDMGPEKSKEMPPMDGMHMDTEKAPAAVTVAVEKKVESTPAETEVKIEIKAPAASDIDRAKQQIKAAEVELAQLKQLVIAAEASPVINDVKKIIELNKGLVAVFDKQIRDYRAQGVSYADPRIKQAQDNIRIAEQELVTYEKQLKNIKPVKNSAKPVEVIKKKVEIKEAVVAPVVPANNVVHEHKPITAKLVNVMPNAPIKPKPKSVETAHADMHEHAAMPMDHMSMPDPSTNAGVEQSAAYKNLHAYHSQGLMPSQFKLSPFGYIQNEVSFATRQLSVIQEFQPFLVPINTAYDANGVDVEDRSQFIPALHAHAGVLIDGPDVLNAHAAGDVSLEFYAPFPLNYAPATDPGLSVRIAGIILIHASMFVEWEKTVLLLGQTWHPGEDPEVSIAFDRVTFFGTLSDPMNRLFQVRLTQKVVPQFKFIAALTSNLDFKAAQNLGIDLDQTQNPYWLNFHFQGRAQVNQNVFAVAADIYTEQPRLFETTQLMLDNDVNEFARQQYFPNTLPNCPAPTRAFSAGSFDNNAAIFATKKSVTSFSMMAFAKVDRDPFVFKAKILAGSSLGHPLGGFAVIDACTSPTPVLNTINECAVTGVNECLDPSSAQCEGGIPCTILTPSPCVEPLPLNAPYEAIRGYGPMRIATCALGLYLKNKIEPGIYIGVTKNLGSKDAIWQFKDLSPLHQECSATNPQTFLCQGTNGLLNASIFKYVSDLDYTILIAPRIKWTIAPVTFSAEIEYTRASYLGIGGVLTNFGTVTCSKPVDVIRFLLEGSFNF